MALKKEYSNTTSIDGKAICLASLGATTQPKLVNDFLDFQFSDAVAIQDVHIGSVALASNSKARHEFWAYIKKNWDTIHGQLKTNPVVLLRFIKSSLSSFASFEVARDIAAFFEDKDQKGYERGLEQATETIHTNAAYKERDEALVLEWLKAHGYLK